MHSNNLILSICIPTYNRKEKLSQQVLDLLSDRDNRFNVVVSDNSSTDGTFEFLLSIKDERLLVFKQEFVSSSRNISNVLMQATGKFALLLLDKDRIDISFLRKLIDELEQTNASFGYCSLNGEPADSPSEFLECKKTSFLQMSYSCKHPSGKFYLTEDLKFELSKCESLIESQFPFLYDICDAHFASKQNGLIIRCPVVCTETEDEAANIKSYTYTEDNLWFSPMQTEKRCQVFLNDLSNLIVKEDWEKSMRNVLVRRCFYGATIGYAKVLNNKKICDHYGIASRKVTFTEQMRYSNRIYRHILRGKNKVGVLTCTGHYIVNTAMIVASAIR